MTFASVANEVVKSVYTNRLGDLVPFIFFVLLCFVAFTIWRTIHYTVARKKIEKMSYEEIQNELILIIEKKEIGNEYKDKILYLMQKAKTHPLLFKFLKQLLFHIRFDFLFTKNDFRINVDRVYNYFLQQN